MKPGTYPEVHMTRVSFILRATMLAVLIGPAALHAQSAFKSSGNEDAYAKALALHTEAVALYDQPRRFAEAARLHVREAHFRSPRDAEAVEALAMAGRLFTYANRLFDARQTMEQAGDRALSIGDVARATHAYLDAAFIARKAGKEGEVTRLVRKAYLLTGSPLLSVNQQGEIRKRFANDPGIAQATK
jgi:hypothetical protein